MNEVDDMIRRISQYDGSRSTLFGTIIREEDIILDDGTGILPLVIEDLRYKGLKNGDLVELEVSTIPPIIHKMHLICIDREIYLRLKCIEVVIPIQEQVMNLLMANETVTESDLLSIGKRDRIDDILLDLMIEGRILQTKAGLYQLVD